MTVEGGSAHEPYALNLVRFVKITCACRLDASLYSPSFRRCQFSETRGIKKGRGFYTPTLLLLGEKALFISRSVTPGPVDFPAVVSSKTVSCWAIAVVVSFPWVRSTLVHSPPAVFTMTISKSGGHGGSHKHHHECAHHENLNDSLHILLHLLSLLIGGGENTTSSGEGPPLCSYTHK